MTTDDRRAPLPVLGVILAGGQSRRMGGSDKSLMQLAGKPLIAHVRDRLAPQVARTVVNANGDATRFAFLDLPVQSDTIPGHAGPLAGILAGMRWAEREAPDLRFVATIATDTPFLPADLVTRLAEATQLAENSIAIANSNANRHPVVGLWPVSLAGELHDFLLAGESGKVMRYVARHPIVDVEFSCPGADGVELDPFFNVNTPGDLELAEALYGRKEGR